MKAARVFEASVRRGMRPAWVLSMVCGLLGCEPADQTPVGRGGRIFQRSCAGCHGADGRGVRRRGLDEKPRDLTQPAFHAEADDARLRNSIRLGKRQMPAFGNLMPEQDVDHLIAFIRSLNPERPKTPPADAPARRDDGSPPSTGGPRGAPGDEAAATAQGATSP